MGIIQGRVLLGSFCCNVERKKSRCPSLSNSLGRTVTLLLCCGQDQVCMQACRSWGCHGTTRFWQIFLSQPGGGGKLWDMPSTTLLVPTDFHTLLRPWTMPTLKDRESKREKKQNTFNYIHVCCTLTFYFLQGYTKDTYFWDRPWEDTKQIPTYICNVVQKDTKAQYYYF